MKNKKGFTLVELLAVIVILALVMGIAVVSVGGVLSSSREKTFRETAASLINGVRQQLYIENAVPTSTTRYMYTSAILEKGGSNSPYGGTYKYTTSCSGTGKAAVGNSTTLCSNSSSLSCSKTQESFVEATVDGSGNVTYKVCLADGTHYVFDNDTNLLNNTATISTT